MLLLQPLLWRDILFMNEADIYALYFKKQRFDVDAPTPL